MKKSATLRDVAEAANVSMGTASLVLNGKRGVAAATRERVLEAARRLGYRASPRRSLRTPHDIVVLVERTPLSPSSDPFNKPILQGMETVARGRGYRLILEFVEQGEPPSLDRWTQDGVTGLVILGGGDLDEDWIRAALATGLPLVMVDHYVPGLEVPTVVPDNFGGAYAMTKHLLEQGHRRIGFVRGPSKYWTLGERLAGYLLAMQQAGLAPPPELIPPRVSHGEEKGYGETLMLLDLEEPPTAIFAVSDKTAIGVYRALNERGISVPGQISVVGFDDIELARTVSPPLTTVRVPCEEMGRVALERLLALIESGDWREDNMRWTLPTRVIPRSSVRRLGS
ncbi:transcriptional regulator, LacI family [Thermobaculum terrenum ATCC BAA-798]|uniref:Transcriptional regulator, LacI family n=1 Tax=Thermobaculum terrenum (strain ATCC BAA-798 / CCMEE 7001 / YNP1) TaxID=525904 RepID=D1CHZ7_THET1|nr:LacI family DNA-binding transcriptional regulator [Thermobaculum terrenum]ACZ43368.1 transcriptional regulator, LacI family [Thermobaculum terrenum ATCC BAA-798]